MSPECFIERKYTIYSDVWLSLTVEFCCVMLDRAWGVCTWEMFTRGEIPYGEHNPAEIIKQILAGELLPMNEDWPAELRKCVQ